MNALLARNDFHRAPVLAAARPRGFKEWHHFVVHGRGVRLLINFSLFNEGSGADEIRLAPRVIVIAHDDNWSGAIERFDERDLNVSADLSELTIGGNRMSVLPDGYRVTIDLPDKDIRGELHFTSPSRPFVVRNQPLGDGRINWLFVPRLRAEGWLHVNGQEHRIENDLAYHDHNWGRFWWGDDFSWTWGTILPTEPDDPWSMVFLQTTDRRPVALPDPGAVRVASRRARRDIPARSGADTFGRSARQPGRLHPAAPDATASGRRGAGRAGTTRHHRDARGRQRACRVPFRIPTPAWPSRARYASTSRPCSAKLVARRGSVVRSGARAWTSSVPVYSSSSMAERVSTLLRRSVQHLEDEVPDSYRLLLAELGPMVVELDVDGEVFSLRGGDRLQVSDGAVADGRCPDRHLAGRHPRSARCQGWDWAKRSRLARSASEARSTTSSVLTTRCSPTSTLRSGRHRSRVCCPNSARGSHERVHTDSGILRATPHRRGPRGRHRRPHRRSRARGARLRRHGVRGRHDERNGLGSEPAGRTRPSSSAASPPRSIRRWAHTTEARPSFAPSLADAASRATPAARLRVNTDFASSRRSTCTSGTCSNASRSISCTQTASGTACWTPTSRTVYDNVRRVITKGITVEGKPSLVFPSEAPAQPRRVSRNPRPTRNIGLHPERHRDVHGQADPLPRHQSLASRDGTAEPLRLRLLRRTRQRNRNQPVLLLAALRRAAASKCQGS